MCSMPLPRVKKRSNRPVMSASICLLEGSELRRERQALGPVFPFDPGYCDCEGFVRARFRIGLAILPDRLRSRQSRAGREGQTEQQTKDEILGFSEHVRILNS